DRYHESRSKNTIRIRGFRQKCNDTMKKRTFTAALLYVALLTGLLSCAQNPSDNTETRPELPLSEQVAATVMSIWKDSFSLDNRPGRWSYDMGVILKGFENIWNNTGDPKYFNYIQKSMDFYLLDEGNAIKAYRTEEYNIDHVNNGKLFLLLHRVT